MSGTAFALLLYRKFTLPGATSKRILRMLMSLGYPPLTSPQLKLFYMPTEQSRRLIPFAILAILLLLAAFFYSNEPQAKRTAPPPIAKMTVEAIELTHQDYPVLVQSYGTVKPRTQSLLVSQASGQITNIGSKFYDGQFFQRGDTLLQLDNRDAKANVKIAQATLIDAQRLLQEEQSRATQAEGDWKRLGRTGKANDMILRKPQLLAAKAGLVSAEANLDKAKLELDRTQIIAPYDGRVLTTLVDLGQVVSQNTQLAEIYATDAVEIRLPIRNRDLGYIDLPEQYRDQKQPARLPAVNLHSRLVKQQHWLGKIVRTESAIDESARQLHVVAMIDQPFAEKNNPAQPSDDTQPNVNSRPVPIKIGQYVTAEIQGRTVADVIVIPEAAIYQNSFVYLAKDDALQRRDISIEWQNGDVALIASGLSEGELLVTTPLGQVTSGTPIKLLGAGQ